MMRFPLLLLCAVSPLAAQFQLYSLDGISELAVPPVQNLGTAGRGEALTARYRLRNLATAPAPLRLLEVAGAGFSLATPVALPQTVPGGGVVDFTVLFRAAGDGQYSAALRSEGVSALLTATVVGRLVVALDTAAGAVSLPSGAVVNFGSVERGASGAVRLLVRNQTGHDEFVPPIAVTGDDFSVAQSPAGALLRPLDDAVLLLSFSPTVSQARRGVLALGTLSFTLSGVGVEPPIPRPGLSVVLPDPAASGQRGTISVLLAERSRTGGRGTVTLTLKPAVVGAVDPGATFPGGGRTVEFVVASGDDRGYFLDQPSIAFETGTTAGVLTANMRLGAYFEEKSIEIPSAPVGIGRLALARTLEGLELTMSGFDNTRTAGPFSCTFFDKTGAPVAPGTIRTDLSADLGRYFQTSTEGGVFQLRAVFPVTGDAAAVDAVDVEVGNAAGVSKARARLQ